MAKSPGAWGRLTRAAIFLRGPAGQTVLDGSREVAWYFRTVPYLPPQVMLVGVMLEDGFRDMFDTIRHPDMTEGQAPVILTQMDQTADELSK